MGLEPLPDIDFNIRSGNALVGFASMEEFREQVEKTLDLTGRVKRVYLQAGVAAVAHRRFINAQRDGVITDIGTKEFAAAKATLNVERQKLNDEFDRYLAVQYGVSHEIGDMKISEPLLKWKESHKPFHWATEFYDIMEGGGFDVVIGNPPYVLYNKELKKQYTVQNYRTESCGDLYAFFVERAKWLAGDSSSLGMIIPLPAFSTDKKAQLMHELKERFLCISSYDTHPSKLFPDVKQRLSIFLSLPSRQSIRTTNYMRWNEVSREHLFGTLWYSPCSPIGKLKSIPKIGRDLDSSIMKKIRLSKPLAAFLSAKKNKHCVYFHDTPDVWTRATDFAPYFWNERDGEKLSVHVGRLYSRGANAASLCALINSALFYWWFVVISGCRNLNQARI